MPRPSSVCIRCGQFKRRALHACRSCGFEPTSEDDQARSLVLSRSFDVGSDVIGLPPAELQKAAELIQGGGQYAFDPEVLAKVRRLHGGARSITRGRLALDLARWLLPPLLVLAIVFMLLAQDRT